MRKNWKGAAAVFAAVAVVFALVGCQNGGGGDGAGGDQAGDPKGPVTVGSKIDTEGDLLASMIKLVLENDGFDVVDRSQTGTTDVVRTALLSGDIDIYPEYTGSGLVFFEGHPDATVETFQDPERGLETVSRLDEEENDIVWLEPARANNTWALATRRDFAEENGLATMSDMAEFVEAGNEVKVAASDEFFNSPAAWPAFADTYGIELAGDQRVVFSGGNTAQTERAVAEATDGINFGMAYGTDGALADLGLIVLDDDKGAQIVYWPTPIVRAEVVAQYPEIRELLDPVFGSLDLETLQELNARIQVQGEDADEVARSYLQEQGFLE
jgi:osmoprotectant transport system substrate-binding protein